MDKTKVVQIGFLVKDIHAAAEAWAGFLGCPVPEIGMTEDYAVTHAMYRGKPCYGRILQAIFPLEGAELELISPVGEEASYWKECLDRDGEGLHHIAFYTREIDRDQESLSARGCEIVQSGFWPDSPRDGAYAYADATASLKCVIELLDYVKKDEA